MAPVIVKVLSVNKYAPKMNKFHEKIYNCHFIRIPFLLLLDQPLICFNMMVKI